MTEGPTLSRFDPAAVDGWALFSNLEVEERRFYPLLDDTGTPYTTDHYELRYLRERLAWAEDLVLLAFVRGHHGPQYLGPDSWVATYPDGDRRALSPAQVAAEFGDPEGESLPDTRFDEGRGSDR